VNIFLLSVFLVRSKKQYIWRFQLEGLTACIEYFNSKVSKKKKLIVDGELKAEAKLKKEKVDPILTGGIFKVHGKDFKIVAVKDSFDLKYGELSFLDLWVAAMKKTGKIGLN